MRKVVFSIGFILSFCSNVISSDTLCKRICLTHSSLGTSGISSLFLLNRVWYAPFNNHSFHLFNDGSNWMQMDKAGHAFTAYELTLHTNRIHTWASGKKQNWVGSVYALGYLTTLELMDGFSEGWGFSIYDCLSNGLGTGFYLGQDWLWNEQRLLPKFSFSPSPYASLRPEVLGSSPIQQILKDYNGQTYWLSCPIGEFIPCPRKLDFLCVSLGYSCDAKLVGDVDTWQQYTAQRQYTFSLDIDLRKVARNKPKLNRVLSQFNCIKLPFPTVVFSKERTAFHWIYF